MASSRTEPARRFGAPVLRYLVGGGVVDGRNAAVADPLSGVVAAEVLLLESELLEEGVVVVGEVAHGGESGGEKFGEEIFSQ